MSYNLFAGAENPTILTYLTESADAAPSIGPSGDAMRFPPLRSDDNI